VKTPATQPIDKAPIPRRSAPRAAPRGRAPKTVGYDRAAGNETWLSPHNIIKAVQPVDLDPATPEGGMPWKTAKRMLKPSDDGLATEWPKADFVFNNPPYGRALGNWLAKAAEHGNGITLVFARVETAAFFESVWWHPNTTAVCIVKGRLRFCSISGKPAGSAGAPSVLIAYGPEAKRRLTAAVRSGAIAGRLIVLGADQKSIWRFGAPNPK
jgi:hypothetical protein